MRVKQIIQNAMADKADFIEEITDLVNNKVIQKYNLGESKLKIEISFEELPVDNPYKKGSPAFTDFENSRKTVNILNDELVDIQIKLQNKSDEHLHYRQEHPEADEKSKELLGDLIELDCQEHYLRGKLEGYNLGVQSK